MSETTSKGRPRARIPRIRKDFYIRQDVAARVDLILLDPMRLKVRYGKWSDLVEELLTEWVLAKQGKKPEVVPARIVREALFFLESGQIAAVEQAIKVLRSALPPQ